MTTRKFNEIKLLGGCTQVSNRVGAKVPADYIGFHFARSPDGPITRSFFFSQVTLHLSFVTLPSDLYSVNLNPR